MSEDTDATVHSGITHCKICGVGGLPWWWVFCEECIAKIRDEQEAKLRAEKFLKNLKAPNLEATE